MYAQVYFYFIDLDSNPPSLVSAGNTEVLTYEQALEVYAETPNPASQMIKADTLEELDIERENLNKRIKSTDWVNHLLDSI